MCEVIASCIFIQTIQPMIVEVANGYDTTTMVMTQISLDITPTITVIYNYIYIYITYIHL